MLEYICTVYVQVCKGVWGFTKRYGAKCNENENCPVLKKITAQNIKAWKQSMNFVI